MHDIVDKQMIKALVMRDITCQQTGKVLDTRTCLVVRDKEGDPILVLDPSAQDNEKLMNRIDSAGWTVDRRKK